MTIIFMFLVEYWLPLYPVGAILKSPLKDANYLVRITYVLISMFFARIPYYIAWVTGEKHTLHCAVGRRGSGGGGRLRLGLLPKPQSGFAASMLLGAPPA